MNIKDVITKVEYNIPIGPKDFIKMFVANAEDNILIIPNNIALMIIFFFNSFEFLLLSYPLLILSFVLRVQIYW